MMAHTVLVPHAIGALLAVKGLIVGFQIGPKIRVGGTLGKIGQDIKTGVGKVAKAVAPAVAFIPGIGEVAAPLLEAGGNILDTTNGGIHNIGDVGRIAGESALMALPGATGLASKLAGGATGLDALPTELKNLAGDANGLLTKIPGVQGLESMFGGSGGAGNTLMSGLGKIFGSGGGAGFLGGSGGGLDNALLLASIAQEAAQKQRQQNLQDSGLNYATSAYDSTAPLRTAGMAKLLNPTYTNLSSIFADPANPFARPAVNPAATSPAPVSGSPVTPVAA